MLDDGVHDVQYSATRHSAIVWSVLGILLDLESGKTLNPTSEAQTDLSIEI